MCYVEFLCFLGLFRVMPFVKAVTQTCLAIASLANQNFASAAKKWTHP